MARLRYADKLRVIGRLLDRERARFIEIEEVEQHTTVSWRDMADEWHVQEYGDSTELERLIREATKARGKDSSPVSQLEPLLRTLGQDLDRAGVGLIRLRGSGSFRVRTSREGERTDYFFSADELEMKNHERKTPRPQPSSPGRSARWPISPTRWRQQFRLPRPR